MMLRYYALCCRNMFALKRHLRHIPHNQLTIVINTLDSEFKNSAVSYCQQESIDYAVTESNGTASQGKNSVIELFLASDYDHFVLIDGDDFLTPHGVWTYQQIANMTNPPDVLALEYQYGIWRETGYGFDYLENIVFDKDALANPFLGCRTRENPEKIMGHGARCFLQDYQWWQRATQGNLVHVPHGDSFAQRLCDAHHRWIRLAYKYISNWETHHRVVFFSRKSCDGYRYDPDFAVGEDTIMYLRYKDAHVKGDLVVKHLWDQLPTYVYDTRVDGVVYENRDKALEGDNLGWCEWLESLASKFEEMEIQGKMHESTELPRINDDIAWPADYIPNTLGLVNFPVRQSVVFS